MLLRLPYKEGEEGELHLSPLVYRRPYRRQERSRQPYREGRPLLHLLWRRGASCGRDPLRSLNPRRCNLHQRGSVTQTDCSANYGNNAIKRSVGKALISLNERTYHSLGSRIVLPSEFEQTGAEQLKPLSELETQYKPETPSLYLHTSGTMKFPKTVVSTDEAQNFVATQYEKAWFDLQEHDKFLAIMPPWIYYGIMGFHMPLSLGMTVLPIPDPNGQRFEDLILDLKPNVVAGVPNHFISLNESKRITPETDLSFAKVFACGGTAINSEKQEEVKIC